MRRAAIIAMLCVSALATRSERAFADAPSAEKVHFAMEEHDLGYRAYRDGHFDEAATHFENAYFAAPNPAELRSAIRARHDAKQLARAATLAAIAKRKYADDAETTKLADATLAAARPSVYELRISSSLECSVAVDAKVVPGERVKDFRFYVDPGAHGLDVSWAEDRAKHIDVKATAGGTQTLLLEPPPAPPKPTGPTGDQAQGTSVVAGDRGSAESSKPLSPAFFIVGAALTAVGTGLSIWSYVDTVKNPGVDAVRRDCVGLGENCPEYQQGLSSQRRTDVLIVTTAAVGAMTAVIGLFFTRWGGSVQTPTRGMRVEPTVGVGSVGVKAEF
jgi:hypothetical protein